MAIKILPQEVHFIETNNNVSVRTPVSKEQLEDGDLLMPHVRRMALPADTDIKVSIMSPAYDVVFHVATFRVWKAAVTPAAAVVSSWQFLLSRRSRRRRAIASHLKSARLFAGLIQLAGRRHDARPEVSSVRTRRPAVLPEPPLSCSWTVLVPRRGGPECGWWKRWGKVKRKPRHPAS